jgi:hypothetical protein
VAIKVLHTAIWAFFAGCIVALAGRSMAGAVPSDYGPYSVDSDGMLCARGQSLALSIDKSG